MSEDGKCYGDYRVVLTSGVTKAWLQSTLEVFATTTENVATFLDK